MNRLSVSVSLICGFLLSYTQSSSYPHCNYVENVSIPSIPDLDGPGPSGRYHSSGSYIWPYMVPIGVCTKSVGSGFSFTYGFSSRFECDDNDNVVYKVYHDNTECSEHHSSNVTVLSGADITYTNHECSAVSPCSYYVFRRYQPTNWEEPSCDTNDGYYDDHIILEYSAVTQYCYHGNGVSVFLECYTNQANASYYDNEQCAGGYSSRYTLNTGCMKNFMTNTSSSDTVISNSNSTLFAEIECFEAPPTTSTVSKASAKATERTEPISTTTNTSTDVLSRYIQHGIPFQMM